MADSETNQASVRGLVGLIEGFSERLGRAVSWASILMVLLTLLVVVLRYAFNLGWIALQESVTYLHAALFMRVGASAPGDRAPSPEPHPADWICGLRR